ncbi:MAG: hypothetical protein AAFQ32_04680 [Pseudomonadota bacterium]
MDKRALRRKRMVQTLGACVVGPLVMWGLAYLLTGGEPSALAFASSPIAVLGSAVVASYFIS